MAVQDNDFEARVKRLKLQPSGPPPTLGQRQTDDHSFDERSFLGAILRPQLAFILGVAALILGRSVAMNSLGIEPSADLLGGGEGAIVIVMLGVIGLLFGKSDHFSHGALIIGASLAFLGERFYMSLAPDLMSSIYNPTYVEMVLLNAR